MLMVLEYRIRTDEDYYVTACARYRRQHRYRWLRPTAVLVWIALAAFIYFSNGAVADWPSIGLSLFFVLLVVALIFSSPLDRALSRRRIRKIPTLNDDWVIRLSDDGMSSSSKRGEGRLDWSGFSRARRFADGLLLFQGPHLFHWFPDSACTQPGLPSELGDLVRRHVSDYRGVGRRSRLMAADQFARLRDAWGASHFAPSPAQLLTGLPLAPDTAALLQTIGLPTAPPAALALCLQFENVNIVHQPTELLLTATSLEIGPGFHPHAVPRAPAGSRSIRLQRCFLGGSRLE